ncbi:hypothetical protein niasHT_013962 [Heterodera trifolii]|uniref:DNA-directed DNA polymerase n=1 Tax=Heterodera trifolii TaxID=157864 RepID=A0ABD2L2P2_9BILA
MRHQRRGQLNWLATRPIEDCFASIERTGRQCATNPPQTHRGELLRNPLPIPLEDAERPDLVLEIPPPSLIQHLPRTPRVCWKVTRLRWSRLDFIQLHPPGFRSTVRHPTPPNRSKNNAAALAAAGFERSLNEQSTAARRSTYSLGFYRNPSARLCGHCGAYSCGFSSVEVVPKRFFANFDAEHHCVPNSGAVPCSWSSTPTTAIVCARAVLLGLRDRVDATAERAGDGTRMDLLRNAGLPVDKQTYTLEDVEQLQQWINNLNGIGQIRLVVFEKEQEYRIVFKGEGVATSTTLVALSNYSKCPTTVWTVSDEQMRVTTQLDVKLYVASAFDSVPDSRVNRNSCQMIEAFLVDATNVASFFRTTTAIITILPTWLPPRSMAEVNANDNQFVNGVVSAEHVVVSLMQTTISVHHSIAPLDQLTVAVVMDGTHWTSPAFFDAETSQERPLQLNNQIAQKHVPLLIVAEVICEPCLRAGISVNDGFGRRAPDCVCLCLNRPGDNTVPPNGAPTFNQRRFYFHSFDDEANDPIEQFLIFLMKHGSKKAHTVCIAHNGGKYDFHLVLEALHRRSIPPKRLFTSSVNWMHSFKSFDLPQHLATVKPFFPYLYIQRQHLLQASQRSSGNRTLFARHDEDRKKRTKFLRWHADNNTNAKFQLREQLILYCVNDVAILRESVLRFRQLIGEHTQGLDPFLCASTAAGLALATLRRCFLPANRLVHSPEGGYLRGRRASAESRRYIRFFELENEGAQVQCADWSVGEAHIEDSGYRVDGLWRRDPPLRPLAIEWMGCFYHGCPECFPDRQQKLAAGRTAEDLYERTMRRLFELEHQHGCELHVIWGCQWKERLRRDHELKQRYEAVFTPCPLDPRNDALRGGARSPSSFHHVCADDEEVLCIDIVSLYPYVMCSSIHRRHLFRGHVRKTTPFGASCSFGFWRHGTSVCHFSATAPKTSASHFHCVAYVLTVRQQRPCRHDDDKRSWVCAYTHVELNKALQLGYVVTDLFEASGWPEGCETEEQRQAFVAEFLRNGRHSSGPDEGGLQPGGKLAQRVGHTEIQYTRTPAEFHKLLDDPTYDKLDFVHVSDHMDRVVVRKRPEFAKAPLTNCLPVAIFVTSYARLHLYGYMEQVLALNNAELLYCDTDSIYYVNKIGAPCVPEGEALGQMKREHVDRRIVEFVAGGPKNYGIRHTARDGTDERANLKIRSFRLSYATQQLINFDAMKELTLSTYNIDGPIDDVIDNDDLFVYGGGAHRAIRVSFPQIDRNVQADLFTREAHKDYRPFYAKGRVRPGMQTRPFGYVEDAPQPMNVEEQPPPPPPARRKRTLIEADPNQPGHSRWF